MAMKACPYRKDFYAKLGDDQEQLQKDLLSYATAMGIVIRQLVKFYIDQGLEKPQ